MAWTIATTHVPTVLDPGTSEVFYDGFLSPEVEYPMLFQLLSSSERRIEKASLLPPGGYQAHPEGQDISTSPVEEGVNLSYVMVEEAIGYEISSYAWEFLQGNPEIAEFIRLTGVSAQRRINAACMSVISTGYTVNGADGVPLYSNAHPRGDGSGNTIDNLGTTAFDIDALETTYEAGLQMVSPEGLPSPVRYDTVVVPVELVTEAMQALAQGLKNNAGGTAQLNTPNVVGGWYRDLIITPEYTDTTDWQVFERGGMPWGKVYFKRLPNPTTHIDTDSHNMKLLDRIVYVAGHDAQWRRTFGHQVAG